jgi:hypothetical protein
MDPPDQQMQRGNTPRRRTLGSFLEGLAIAAALGVATAHLVITLAVVYQCTRWSLVFVVLGGLILLPITYVVVPFVALFAWGRWLPLLSLAGCFVVCIGVGILGSLGE